MAENAVHISTTPQPRPTIFEVVAQESLMDTLQPAAKVICEFLSSKYPERLSWLTKWFEECFLGVNFCLQYHYIKRYQASFSEAFYGLQRVPLSPNMAGKRLSLKQEVLTMFTVVLFPYLRNKVKELADKYQQELYGMSQPTKSQRAMMVYVELFRAFNVVYEFLKLCQYLAYMTGRASNHNPLLSLARVRLVYQQEHFLKSATWKDLYNSLFDRDKKWSSIMFSLVVKVLSESLETSAFFIQFLKWWHSDESRTKTSTRQIPDVSLIPRSKSSEKGLCPICLNRRKVEVTLQTSGYVFCYACIRKWLQKYNFCPVTQIPSTVDDLIRLYPAEKGNK